MTKEKMINKSNDLSFEQHLDRAKDIIAKLESGNCNLDELLSKYKDGIESVGDIEDITGTSYTKLSCDSDSNYFIQYLDGFYPDRVYKILLKLKYDDGQEQIFDDDFEFVVRRR